MSEPAGLDQFVGAVPSAPPGGAPQGLDQFIAPEMNEEQYGGASGMATSAALGAASGATLGLSNYALTHSGLMKPETLKAYQETNPGTYGGSEFAGAVGSLLVAPELSPAAMIGKVGKAVQGATEIGALAKPGAALAALGINEGSHIAKVLSTTADLGSHALGSAVEGALYSGLGNTMNEYSIGDPSLNGEKLASVFGHNLGTGALYGGALGGALKAASTVLPESLGAMKRGLGEVKDTLMGTGEKDSGGVAGKALGVLDGSGKLSDHWSNRMEALDPDQQAKLIDKVTTTLNEVHNNSKTALKDFNGTIRPAAVDALIDTVDQKAVLHGQQDMINHVLGAIEEIKTNPGIYDQNAAAKLEKFHTQLVEGLKEGNEPADIFNRTRDVQKKISDWGQGVVANTQTADTKALLNDLSGKMNSYLKDPDVFGLVGSNLSEHNEMLSKVYSYVPPFEKKSNFTSDWMTNTGTAKNPRLEFDPKKVQRIFKSGDQAKIDRLNGWFETMKALPEHIENTASILPNEGMDQNMLNNIEEAHQAVKEGQVKFQENLKNSKGRKLGLGEYAAATLATAHPVLGGILELYNLASRPMETINKMAEVERLVNKATNLIGRGSRAIFDPSIKLGEIGRGELAELGARDHAKEHGDLHSSLAQMANDPKLMMGRLSAATDSLHGVAPETAQSLQFATVRATQFLASKLPSPGDTDPFSSPYQPSKTELATFERYRQIVEKPLTALAQVKNKTIGPEAIEALMQVHPKLYEAMKNSVIESASKVLAKKEPISFQTKQAVSIFLGQPLDRVMAYPGVMANQQVFSQAQHQSAMSTAKPSKGGMQKMTLAQRTGMGRDQKDT